MIIIHVDVIKILGILEDSEIISVQFNLTAIWQDPRLTYRNLKKENFKNIVSKTEGDTIWYPVVLFQVSSTVMLFLGYSKVYNGFQSWGIIFYALLLLPNTILLLIGNSKEICQIDEWYT